MHTWRAAAAAVALALLAAPAAAPAAGPGPRPYFDIREGRAATPAAPRAGAASARAALRRSLGAQAVVDVDPLTATPRVVARLDGALTGPSATSDRVGLAERYVRSHLAALGLTTDDLGSLGVPERIAGGGVEQVRWRQTYGGIPAFDNDLRVNLARDGRVLSVLGSPRHDLKVASTTPALDAAGAVRLAMRDAGTAGSVRVARGPSGPRRETEFASGDSARLVLFGDGARVRLAWRVLLFAGHGAVYDTIFDAGTRALLHRQNLVKSALPADVWDSYPGDAHRVDLEPWLGPGATRLENQYVHVYSDVNDDDVADASVTVGSSTFDEDVHPAAGSFVFTLQPFMGTGCSDATKCSWNPGDHDSWLVNREQNAVQAFYLASVYRQHLAATPIGFDGFAGDDQLQLNTDDGAIDWNDGFHADNANMATLPEGRSPRMQMYLFGDDPDWRAVNGGDDAAILFHEYTHGLSSRLITDSDGFAAVNSPQAGAMGEAWSDWYAKAFLNEPDTAAPGEIDMGVYTDRAQHTLRTQAMDCPVGADPQKCPGTLRAGSGGYTYGDFGRVGSAPEVHNDGEIWGETLWDLRTALGDAPATRLVTDAMRLSPPEPSFLDERNAILQADVAATGGANRATLWSLFAARGMGYYASTSGGFDAQPAEDTSPPPAPGGPRGAIAGTVRDSSTARPLAGVTVSIGGLAAGPDALAATTGADGRYRIDGVPARTYANLVFGGSGGYERAIATSVQVLDGQTTVRDQALRRDWAASAGGATVTADNDHFVEDIYGDCGPTRALDELLDTGWSTFNPTSPNAPPGRGGDPATMTIRLPEAVDVNQFLIDPGAICGDADASQTKDLKVETSPDGTTFSLAAQGSFPDSSAGGRLNAVPASGDTHAARFVRITLLSPLVAAGSGADFIDLAELEVVGTPTALPNLLPSGTVSASPAAATVGQTVRFDASGMSDPDGTIREYHWSFGDGAGADGAAAEHAYGAPGTYTATLTAVDSRGGRGTATVSVTVTAALVGPGPPVTPPPRRATPPSITPSSSGRRGVAVRVRCDSRCNVAATLTVDARTARRLGTGRRVGSVSRTLARAGPATVTVRLSARALRALRRRHVRVQRATLRVTVSEADGDRRVVSRAVRLRL